jgi:hypothetical protein
MSEAERVCSEVIGSETGELFYKCAAEFSGYAHWSGPFFSALILGILASFFIFAVASS